VLGTAVLLAYNGAAWAHDDTDPTGEAAPPIQQRDHPSSDWLALVLSPPRESYEALIDAKFAL
jgi:hypothetical protein